MSVIVKRVCDIRWRMFLGCEEKIAGKITIIKIYELKRTISSTM